MNDYKYLDAASFLGKTFTAIEQMGSDRIEFTASDGKRYVMLHQQDCCESVNIEQITGDLASLIGMPLTVARESCNEDFPDGFKSEDHESVTATTYFFETTKTKVRIRWIGSSNGYYSESVQIEELT